jgi:glutathione S-transferase
MPKPKFVYWKAASRAQNAMLMFHVTNKEYEWDSDTANKWPQSKSLMPFGQLPVFYDEDNNLIAQSNAITRYCAKICGLMPNIPYDIAKVDMLIEQSNDIFNLMAKCKYAGDDKAQVEAWREFKEKKIHDKLLPLNSMIVDNETFYGGATPDASDVCVFSVINLVVRAGVKDCLIPYPKLYEHYKNMIEQGTVKEYLMSNVPTYFVFKDKVDVEKSSSVSN